MGKIFNLLFLSLAMLLATGADAFAARSHHVPTFHNRHQQENQQQGQPQTETPVREVKNDFFSIKLPDGWTMQKPVRPIPTGASATFNKGASIAVNLNIIKAPFTNQQIAEKTAANMRKRGMEVSVPREKDGFYIIDISKKGVNGQGWFGSDGKTAAITTIFAPRLDEANELLKALKTATPGIVPSSVE